MRSFDGTSKGMTGIGWLDTTSSVVFAVLALLAAVRLAAGRRHLADRGDAALHVLMAAGMAAMGGPVPAGAWVAVFGAATCWCLVRLARTGWPGHAWATTGHHLAASIVMVIAFGAGHGGHHAEAGSEPAGPDHAHHQHMAGGTGSGSDMVMASSAAEAGPGGPLAAAAEWPIWPVVGAAFLAGAAWRATAPLDRRMAACTGAPPSGTSGDLPSPEVPRWRRLVESPLVARLCAVTMSVGMAGMASSL